MAKRSKTRTWIHAGLGLLFLLHNDFWNWTDSSRVLGLPVGLFYHLAFCAVATVLFFLLVRHAWPRGLGEERGGEPD